MLAEVLIFLPSVANFRINWLTDRLTAARLASLAADAAPDRVVPPMLRNELLSTAPLTLVSGTIVTCITGAIVALVTRF